MTTVVPNMMITLTFHVQSVAVFFNCSANMLFAVLIGEPLDFTFEGRQDCPRPD